MAKIFHHEMSVRLTLLFLLRGQKLSVYLGGANVKMQKEKSLETLTNGCTMSSHSVAYSKSEISGIVAQMHAHECSRMQKLMNSSPSREQPEKQRIGHFSDHRRPLEVHRGFEVRLGLQLGRPIYSSPIHCNGCLCLPGCFSHVTMCLVPSLTFSTQISLTTKTFHQRFTCNNQLNRSHG